MIQYPNENHRSRIKKQNYLIIWIVFVTIVIIAFFVEWYMNRVMNVTEIAKYMIKCSNEDTIKSPIYQNHKIPKITDFIEDDIFY